ncbi:hypothetical protein M0R45_004941 [Rubus argutus]|uniref:Uncharacterized protein n=1 Tax=Rubus argutus TaxID=59490 RepID=A0AAW1YLA8_RUBAR
MVNCDYYSSGKAIARFATKTSSPSLRISRSSPSAAMSSTSSVCKSRSATLTASRGTFARCASKDASQTTVARLYFESAGNSAESTFAWKCGEDSEAFRREVKELKEELSLCKEQAKKEVANLKNEALKQQTSMQEMLQMRTEAVDKLTLECSRLQERNMALTKELASFKLVSQLDLDEKEVLHLAALGNGANSKNTIDVLRKSLVMSNRNCKELMAQCNLLERGEDRLGKKLEKAKGKINILNTKVQELTDQCNLLERGEARYSRKLEKAKGKINKLKTRVQELDSAVKAKKETTALGPSDPFDTLGSMSSTCNDTAKAPADDIADVLILDDVKQVQPKLNIRKESLITRPLARPDAVILDDVNQVQPMHNTSKESPITQPLPRPVSAYFSGGLLGPDGTKRFLGKWCKRSQNNESVTSKDSSRDADHLIVLVSDEEDIKENLPRIKRCKYEAESKSSQSQECLQ